jgi:glycerol-3-phosphate O-acyltransferase/dihydroxyacetone phosphate acyltransferase
MWYWWLTWALAATIPHRRQISFWAKASTFKNPILRFILVSSGAIPVHRNPNNLRDAPVTGTGTARSSGNEPLFHATSRALAGLRPRGGLLNRLVGMFPDRVVGVFPEGTSYTEPCIIQVKEGAAWVALEYSRWLRVSGDRDGQPIKIIPVGIAYTDKTQYLSRVSIEQSLSSGEISTVALAGLCTVGIHVIETAPQLIHSKLWQTPRLG